MRPSCKARRLRIPGVFDGGATPQRGMQRQPNAEGFRDPCTRMAQSMKTSKSLLCAALSLALMAGAGCGDDSPTAPSLNIPYSATDITVGTGTEAVTGKTVRVYYTGWLYSTTATDNKGGVFDSNLTGLGFSFTVGAGTVIKGWDQGVPGMKVGGKRRLIIPPELGYGANGNGPAIPGNATLIFEIQLLGVAG